MVSDEEDVVLFTEKAWLSNHIAFIARSTHSGDLYIQLPDQLFELGVGMVREKKTMVLFSSRSWVQNQDENSFIDT